MYYCSSVQYQILDKNRYFQTIFWYKMNSKGESTDEEIGVHNPGFQEEVHKPGFQDGVHKPGFQDQDEVDYSHLRKRNISNEPR